MIDVSEHYEHVQRDNIAEIITGIKPTGMHLLCVDALVKGEPLSIVRMSDGEYEVLKFCREHRPDELMERYDKEWRQKYGCDGIRCGELESRLARAAKECTYFSPDGWMNFFVDFFPLRMPFASLYFHHHWTVEQKKELFDAAGSVLVVNRDKAVRNVIAENSPDGVAVDWLCFDNWRETGFVVEKAVMSDAHLVIVSAGCAGKCVIPEIANASHKVVLDVGSGAARWWTPYE